MGLPESAHGPCLGGHQAYLQQVQARLLREYADLLKNPVRKRNRDDIETATRSISRRARAGTVRRRIAPRYDPPVYRFSDPPFSHYRPQRRPRQPELARVFVLMLLLHGVIIGGIVIGDMMDWSMILKAVGLGVVVWLLFRGMAALSRRITPPRRTTTHVTGRNCDRDIWL